MQTIFMSSEPWLRICAFGTVFLVMALWELKAPFRAHSLGRTRRWPGNIGVVVVGTLAVRLLLPLGAVGIATMAESGGWGLLNVWKPPGWLAIVIAVLVLDLAIYLQHVMFHALPALWRLHRMHHADLELDLTTGARFHAIEIVLSMVIKMAVVAALGAPPVAVLVFEILLNTTSMFNHANVRLPAWAEPIVRKVLVTPDMHRVHHSVEPRETNSNFGFNLAIWDRLFGTYVPEPALGQHGLVIGVKEIRDPTEQRLDRMLTQPFRGASSYALGRRERGGK